MTLRRGLILFGIVLLFAVGASLVGATAVGDRLTLDCETVTVDPDGNPLRLDCLVLALVTPTPAPDPTSTPDPAPVGRCGEPMDRWHPPVVDGCETGHEHGDPPPQWVADAGYEVRYGGPLATSEMENTDKHAGYKGFVTTFNGVELYFRMHALSHAPGRSGGQFHSAELWAFDQSGAVSHWQWWIDMGDVRPHTEGGNRVPRRSPPLPEENKRPLILVVDQTSLDQGISCEQWYEGGGAGWQPDLGWTICGATTLYDPDERFTLPSIGELTGYVGETRRLELSYYAGRGNPPLDTPFWATQFGEIVSGPDDVRCAQTTDAVDGKTYENVCLAQFIASTLPTIQFPGNAAQKTFDATGVEVPN